MLQVADCVEAELDYHLKPNLSNSSRFQKSPLVIYHNMLGVILLEQKRYKSTVFSHFSDVSIQAIDCQLFVRPSTFTSLSVSERLAQYKSPTITYKLKSSVYRNKKNARKETHLVKREYTTKKIPTSFSFRLAFLLA